MGRGGEEEQAFRLVGMVERESGGNRPAEGMADDADARKLLQESQRAWIAFRDAECKFSSSGVDGGSVYPMVHALCLQGLTDERIMQLGAYLKCEEGDMSCPVPAAP